MTSGDAYEARVRRLRRRAAASRAAYALHEQQPDLARQAGAKGGAARASQMTNPQAYGRWLARRRWHGALAGPPPRRAAEQGQP